MLAQHLPLSIDELIQMLDSSQNSSASLRHLSDPMRLSGKEQVVEVEEGPRNLLIASLVVQKRLGITRHENLIFDFSTALANPRRDILNSIWLATKEVTTNPPGLSTELVQVDINSLLIPAVKQSDTVLVGYALRWKELDKSVVGHLLYLCCHIARDSTEQSEVLDLLLSTNMAYPSLAHLANCNIPSVALKLLRSKHYGYRHCADRYVLEVEELISSKPYVELAGYVKHKFGTADEAGYCYRDHYRDCRPINRDGNWTSCVTDDVRFRVVVYKDQVLEVKPDVSTTVRKKIEEMNKMQPRGCD